jgi:hypothetical protein
VLETRPEKELNSDIFMRKKSFFLTPMTPATKLPSRFMTIPEWKGTHVRNHPDYPSVPDFLGWNQFLEYAI